MTRSLLRLLTAAAGLLLVTALPIEAQQAGVPDAPGNPSDPDSRLVRRWRWHYDPRGFSAENAPPDAIARVLNVLAARKAIKLEAPPAVAGTWVNVGPSPILGGQIGLRKGERSVNGRVRAVAVDPENEDHWLIGAAQGGIWETFDGGRTWKAKTDDQCSLAMGAIAFGPRDPTTGLRPIYAGTGEASTVASAYGGIGLLVYGDDQSGQWHPRPVPRKGQPCHDSKSSGLVGLAFSRLLVDPSKPQRLVAATIKPGHPAIAAEPTERQRDVLGVITSADGGHTWLPQSMCGLEDFIAEGATDVAINPNGGDHLELYAGLKLKFKKKDGGKYGVYRWRDDCWTQVGGVGADDIPMSENFGRIEFAFTPRQPGVLYVSISDLDGFRLNGLRGLWRTTNAWEPAPVFRRVSQTGGTGGGPGEWGYCAHPVVGVQRVGVRRYEGVCYYAHAISLDPGNRDVIYAGGVGLWKAVVTCPENGNGICGAEWTEVSQLTTPYPHAPRLHHRGIHVDQQAMAWAGRRLITVTDGGVWSTSDGGTSWQDHNQGLSIVQFYGGAVADHDGRLVILAGAQDNGTMLWTGSAWRFVKGGDAGRPVLSSRNPDTHWGLTYASIVEGLTIQRTRDAGVEFMGADSPISPFMRDRYFPGGPLAACTPPDPRAPSDIVLAAAGPDVWRNTAFFSSASSPTWSSFRAVEEHDTVRQLAVDPTRCHVVALAIEQPESSDRGDTVYSLRVTDALSDAIDAKFRQVARFTEPISALAFDPGTDRVYLTLSGLTETRAKRVDNVFSVERAAKVVELNTAFPASHNAIALVSDKKDPDRVHVWVGTDLGVLHGHCHRTATTDPCRWTRHEPDRGMPNVAVTDIQVSASGQIVAFTYGRGAFQFVEGAPPCEGKPVVGLATNFLSCDSAKALREGRMPLIADPLSSP